MLPALVSVVVIVGAAPSAAAPTEPWTLHTTLESSSPAAGDTVPVPPTEVTLAFGGLVEVTGAALTLLGSGGHMWTLRPTRPGADQRVITGALPSLEPGGYRMEWRVISADGHAIAGDFVFYVGGGEGDLAAPPPSAAADGDHAATGHGDLPAGAIDGPVPLVIVRSGANLALLALAGLLLFASLEASGGTPRTAATMRVLAVAGPIMAATYGWIWVGGVLGDASSAAARMEGLLSLTSGRALAAEIVLAALTAWALLLARRPGIATAFALLAVAAGGGAGHPAAYSRAVAVPASIVHLLAAALWIGGLLFLVTERRSTGYPASARRVSQVALASVVVIALTGVVQTFLILGSVPWITGTVYEQMVVAKIAGFLGLIAFAAYHRTRLLPIVDAQDGTARLSTSVQRELALAVGVVVLAAVLSHVPPIP